MGIEGLGVNLNACSSLMGTESGEVIILGGGRCVWDDFGSLAPHHNMKILVVNDVGMHVPYYPKHWYSNDNKMLDKWLQARRPLLKKNIDRGPIKMHTHQTGTGAMNIWPWPGHGTSGLNACYTALALGYEKVILCGIPLDDSGHYFDPPWTKTNFVREVPERDGEHRWWTMAKRKVFDGRVKSLSGRSRDLLGAP